MKAKRRYRRSVRRYGKIQIGNSNRWHEAWGPVHVAEMSSHLNQVVAAMDCVSDSFESLLKVISNINIPHCIISDRAS